VNAQSAVRVAVVGATGYAGAELVRLLARHPRASLTAVTSERDAGRVLGQVHRTLSFVGLTLEAADVDAVAKAADIAFVALPHGTSTGFVSGLLERGLRVVDLGADFRFSDRALYEQWYGPHAAPELLGEAVYGLTEHARAAVSGARLVANPGCYPTGALMALAPLADAVRGVVIVDSKSGTSGAGRKAATGQLFAEVTENIRPYAVWEHRHQPEIEFHVGAAGARDVHVLFAPHLLPVARGLLTACYFEAEAGLDVSRRFSEAYGGEPFVRLLGEDGVPEPRNVRGTNLTEIGWRRDARTGRVVVMTAIDNLGKGAAGQAVQNFNCMTGIEETCGLDDLVAALP